jgi:hypothetical protein
MCVAGGPGKARAQKRVEQGPYFTEFGILAPTVQILLTIVLCVN